MADSDATIKALRSGYSLVVGVDEVGRGPLAGPVVAAAVVLDPKYPIDGLGDSKKLTAKRREALAPIIQERALAWHIAAATVAEIDEINILQATLVAMTRAVEGLSLMPDLALVDGNRLPRLECPAKAVIGGDDKVAEISAASIIAKVWRDNLMVSMADQYPGYGFEAHKGYGTAGHLAALRSLGPTPIHRTSFAPVRNALATIETAS